jgi:hypothetical protein
MDAGITKFDEDGRLVRLPDDTMYVPAHPCSNSTAPSARNSRIPAIISVDVQLHLAFCSQVIMSPKA